MCTVPPHIPQTGMHLGTHQFNGGNLNKLKQPPQGLGLTRNQTGMVLELENLVLLSPLVPWLRASGACTGLN